MSRFPFRINFSPLTNWDEDWWRSICDEVSCCIKFSRVNGETIVSVWVTNADLLFTLLGLAPRSVWTEVNRIVRGLWPSEHTRQAKNRYLSQIRAFYQRIYRERFRPHRRSSNPSIKTCRCRSWRGRACSTVSQSIGLLWFNGLSSASISNKNKVSSSLTNSFSKCLVNLPLRCIFIGWCEQNRENSSSGTDQHTGTGAKYGGEGLKI